MRLHLVVSALLLLTKPVFGLVLGPIYPSLNSSYPLVTAGLYANEPLRSANPDIWCSDREEVPCTSMPIHHICLTRDQLMSLWVTQPNIPQSFTSRHDLQLVIESQSEPNSLVLTEILRILLSEIAGFSVKIIQNGEYQVQLPRCSQGIFDFHPNIWRTDWSNEKWARYTDASTYADACVSAGPSGVLGRDAWYTDTYTVQANGVTNPRDFWSSYTLESVVSSLPQFNATQAIIENAAALQADPTLVYLPWFVPPQCTGKQICGVAYGFSTDWEPGVSLQQVVNLKLLIVVHFPPIDEHNIWQALMDARLAAKQHVLGLYYEPDPFTASEQMTRVKLPDPTNKCFSQADHRVNGIGSVNCDFIPTPLSKLMRQNTNTDLQDAFSIFAAMQVTHQNMMDALQSNFHGKNIAEVACDFLQSHIDVWTSWFKVATPRKHEVLIQGSTKITIYVLLSIFTVFSIACHIFLFVFREHAVIKRSSYKFNQLFIFGSLLYYITLIIGIQDDTKAICITSQYLLSISFITFWISLLVKTSRLYFIFTGRQFKSRKISDSKLGLYMLAYACIDMGLVIIWSSVDPPIPTLELMPHDQYAFVSKCTSSASHVFVLLLYLLRAIALLVGVYFALRIRTIEDSFNESKFLVFISYNICVVAVVILGIQLISTGDPQVLIGSWMGGISFSVFLSVVIFILAKIYAIWQYVLKPSTGTRNGSTGRITTRAGSHINDPCSSSHGNGIPLAPLAGTVSPRALTIFRLDSPSHVMSPTSSKALSSTNNTAPTILNAQSIALSTELAAPTQATVVDEQSTPVAATPTAQDDANTQQHVHVQQAASTSIVPIQLDVSE